MSTRGTDPAGQPLRIIATVLVFDNQRGANAVMNAITHQTLQPESTIVVDNGSQPPFEPPARAVADSTPTQLRRLQSNGGVGVGHNTGIRAAVQLGADWVWVLEHDSLPDPDCLEKLSTAARELPSTVAVVAPHFARNRYERDMWREAIGSAVVPLDRATFNGVLLRTKAWQTVGPIREDLFVGLEDWEYAQRLRRDGWTLQLVSSPSGIHSNRGAGRFPTYSSPNRHYYSCRNELLLATGREKLRAVCRQAAGIPVDFVRYRSLRQARARLTGLVHGIRGRSGSGPHIM